MTLLRPLDFRQAAEPVEYQSLRTSGKVPFLIGFVVFITSVGFAIPLPATFYLQAGLCPIVIASAFVLSIRDQSIGAIKIDPALALMCTWSVMSIGWTIASVRSGASAAVLLVMAVLTAFLGSSLVNPQALLRWMAIAMAIMLGLVLVHGAVSPGVAFSAAPGEIDGNGLRSFFAAKNALGQTLIYAVALRVVVKPGRWRLAANILLPVLLVLCNNSGAIIASTVLVGVQLAIRWVANERARGNRGGLFVLGGSMIFAIFSVIVGRNVIYGLVGRGSDLTGRDVIWKYTFIKAVTKPILGFGVAGFWKYGGGPAEFVRSRSGWAVTSAHQGWLEVFLEYGIIGVILELAVIIATISRIVRRLSAGDSGAVTVFSAGIVTGLVVGSLSESTLMFPGLALLGLVNGLMYNDPVRPVETVREEVSYAQ